MIGIAILAVGGMIVSFAGIIICVASEGDNGGQDSN